VRFPDEHHPGLFTPPSHPVQLYASIINLGFFFLLARWERQRRRDGELFWAYIALYGLYRYAMEFFRAGATSTYLIPSLHLTDTHVISVVMMVVGIGGILWLRRHRPAYRDGELPPAPISDAETPRPMASALPTKP
jgi:phosphatidylglycerol:prolipoprotein diacylglycerol transferase